MKEGERVSRREEATHKIGGGVDFGRTTPRAGAGYLYNRIGEQMARGVQNLSVNLVVWGPKILEWQRKMKPKEFENGRHQDSQGSKNSQGF